jgi:hypothetical protein
MKIAFDKQLVDLHNKPVPLGDGTETIATFGLMSVRVLLVDTQADKPEQKLARFQLALKIQGGADDITVDEAKLLLDRVKQVCSTLLVGRFDQLLNGASAAK